MVDAEELRELSSGEEGAEEGAESFIARTLAIWPFASKTLS